MEEKIKKIFNSYNSVEARQAVDYIDGICEKCFYKGLFGYLYPKQEVIEIIKVIADEAEFKKQN